MTKVRKSVLILGSLVMTAGLTFGAPIHWPSLHHKSKQKQADTTKAPKQKKSHHWLHHGKKSKKSADSTSDSQ